MKPRRVPGGPRPALTRGWRRADNSGLWRSEFDPTAQPNRWGVRRMKTSVATLCGALVLFGSGIASAAGLRGDYVEARTADVFTGPCFSNAEIFIYGNQAVLAWKVTE